MSPVPQVVEELHARPRPRDEAKRRIPRGLHDVVEPHVPGRGREAVLRVVAEPRVAAEPRGETAGEVGAGATRGRSPAESRQGIAARGSPAEGCRRLRPPESPDGRMRRLRSPEPVAE